MIRVEEKATSVGVAQIISGIINLIVMSMGWLLLGTTIGGAVSTIIIGLLTLGMCPLPIGGLWGLVGVLPLIIGVLGIVSGAAILTDPKRYREFGRFIAILEVLSVLYGGVCSVLIGAFVLSTLEEGPTAADS
ncbi:MAG: hypothetical protein ACJAZO_000913 [Myxococcota bacterium]|jgi:hypothetical protein